LEEEKKKIKEKLNQLEKDKDNIVSVYVTFESMEEKNYIMNKLNSSPCAYYC